MLFSANHGAKSASQTLCVCDSAILNLPKSLSNISFPSSFEQILLNEKKWPHFTGSISFLLICKSVFNQLQEIYAIFLKTGVRFHEALLRFQ